jgi:hypothetical protein
MSEFAEQYRTFHSESEIKSHFEAKEQADYESCIENRYLVSEGFFRNLDGLDRKTKIVHLSIPYRVIENKLKDYDAKEPTISDQDLKIFKSKLGHIQKQIGERKYGQVYYDRGACGIFSECCVRFEIYEVVNNGITIIWTSLILDRILNRKSPRLSPEFYRAILHLYNCPESSLQILSRNDKRKTPFNYTKLTNDLNSSGIYNNPLFAQGNDDLIGPYRLMANFSYTYRFLTKMILEKREKREELYVAPYPPTYADLLIGVTGNCLNNIEWVQIRIGIDLRRYSEIRHTVENMPYIPVSDLPMPICNCCYATERYISIKFKTPPTESDELFFYDQNYNNRDEITRQIVVIPKDKIIIPGGFPGIYSK